MWLKAAQSCSCKRSLALISRCCIHCWFLASAVSFSILLFTSAHLSSRAVCCNHLWRWVVTSFLIVIIMWFLTRSEFIWAWQLQFRACDRLCAQHCSSLAVRTKAYSDSHRFFLTTKAFLYFLQLVSQLSCLRQFWVYKKNKMETWVLTCCKCSHRAQYSRNWNNEIYKSLKGRLGNGNHVRDLATKVLLGTIM